MSDDEFEEYVIEKPKKNYDAFDEIAHQDEFTDFQQAQKDNPNEDEFDDFKTELPQPQGQVMDLLNVITQEKQIQETIEINQQQSVNPIIDRYKVLSDQFIPTQPNYDTIKNGVELAYSQNNEFGDNNNELENKPSYYQQSINYDDSHEFEEYQQILTNQQKQDLFDQDEFDDYESHPVIPAQIQNFNQPQQQIIENNNYQDQIQQQAIEQYNHISNLIPVQSEMQDSFEDYQIPESQTQQNNIIQTEVTQINGVQDDIITEQSEIIEQREKQFEIQNIKDDKEFQEGEILEQPQQQPIQPIQLIQAPIQQQEEQKGNKYIFFDDLLQDDAKQEDLIPKIEFVQIPIQQQQQQQLDIMSVIKSSYQEQNVRKDSLDSKKPKLQISKIPEPVKQDDEEIDEQYDNYDYSMQSIPKMNKQQQRLQFQTPMIQNDKNLFSFENGSEQKQHQDVQVQQDDQDEFVEYQTSQPEIIQQQQKLVPMREWRQQIQKQVGDDADCLELLYQELQELELDIYLGQILEYKQLVKDIQRLRKNKLESLEKEEFEVLIVIRDTLRAKEPIALQLKQRVLEISNIANIFGQIPLRDHINNYLIKNGQTYTNNPTISQLQPIIKEDNEFISKLQKELQKSASVLKIIKLRTQHDKIKFEQKYLNFINGLKRIIQMSFRFKNIQKYVDSCNEALQDFKIEKVTEKIDEEYLLESILVPFLQKTPPTVEYCNLCFQSQRGLQTWRNRKYHAYCVNFYYQQN